MTPRQSRQLSILGLHHHLETLFSLAEDGQRSIDNLDQLDVVLSEMSNAAWRLLNAIDRMKDENNTARFEEADRRWAPITRLRVSPALHVVRSAETSSPAIRHNQGA